MSTWADRLEFVLAANRAALDQAKISGSAEDWQRVLETGKAIRDFFDAHSMEGSPRLDAVMRR